MKKTRFIHTTRPSQKKLLISIIASRVEHRKKTKGPVSLYKIDDDILLNKQVSILSGIKAEIALSLGYHFDRVINKVPDNVRVVENLFFDSTNDVEDIRLCMNNFKSQSILIMDGSVVPSGKLFNMIDLDESSIIMSNKVNSISVFRHGDYLTQLYYDKHVEDKWAKIAYFTNKEFDLFKNLCCRDNNTKLTHEIINQIIDSSGKFKIIQDNDTYKL